MLEEIPYVLVKILPTLPKRRSVSIPGSQRTDLWVDHQGPPIFLVMSSSGQMVHYFPGSQNQLNLNQELDPTKNVFVTRSFNL